MPQNPPWTTDELLIAVDLYVNHPRARSVKSDPALVEASAALRALPIHPERPDPATFRNVNSVYLKLQNFKAVDPSYPGVGMRAGGGERERELLARYLDQPEAVAVLARAINAQARALREDGVVIDPLEDEGVEEGAILMATHRRRERRSSGKKKAAVLAATRRLVCEACGFDFLERYGEIGRGFAECHHTRPMTDGVRTTRLTDLAIVCSNCHRMIHRRSPPLSLDELRALLS